MEFLLTFFHSAVGSEVFAAGLVLGLAGAAFALLAGLWRLLAALLWRRIALSVSLDNRSRAFEAFSHWLAEGDRLRRCETCASTPAPSPATARSGPRCCCPAMAAPGCWPTGTCCCSTAS